MSKTKPISSRPVTEDKYRNEKGILQIVQDGVCHHCGACIGFCPVGTLGLDETLAVPIATAEDVIVIKLERYRLGNEASERQWDDVSRLMALLGDTADLEYLQQASESVGVADLLQRLREG